MSVVVGGFPTVRRPGVGLRHPLVEFALVAVVVLLIQLVSALTQQRIDVNEGRGFDGTVYHAVAEQLSEGERPSGESRFARRLGTPFLAALLGSGDLIRSFTIVNAVASVVSALLLLLWLRWYVSSPWLRVALVAVYATHWLQLTRFTFFYPVLVDACAQTCCFAGLNCIAWYERKPGRWPVVAISLVSVAGVLFRELVLLIPLAFLFARNPQVAHRIGFPYFRASNFPRLGQWVPLALAVAALAFAARFVIPSDPAFSAVTHLENRAYSRSLVTYLLGWLIAFGPALFVVLFDWRPAVEFLSKHRAVLVHLLGVAAVGWAGSLESERHALYWAAPIVYVLVGRSVERHGFVFKSWTLIAALIVAHAIGGRLFLTTPQPVDNYKERQPAIVLTPVGPDASYLHLFPNYVEPAQVWVQWGQYLLLGGVFMIWMNRRAFLQAATARRATSGSTAHEQRSFSGRRRPHDTAADRR